MKQTLLYPLRLSFPRKRESKSVIDIFWTPASAGVTDSLFHYILNMILSRVGDLLQGDDFDLTSGLINVASIEYGNNPFLRPVFADAN